MFCTRISWVALAVVFGVGGAVVATAADPPPTESRFPPLNNDEAWKRLPRPTPPLPAWAQILTASLPRTTAAMLQLDHLHRANNPLGAVQAGKLRWAVADTIGCDYAKQYAEADLRRAGLTDADLQRLAGDPRQLPRAERAALGFARKVTRAAYTVTDAEMSELLEHFGPDRLVAMVHTLAFANFQNRIFLVLRVEVESGGPLPPLDVKLDPSKPSSVPAPARPPWESVVKATDVPRADVCLDWQKDADLEKLLEQQKSRKGRISLPDPARLTGLRPESKAQAERIVWTNVSMGYQPQLTQSWFDCMAIFPQEAKLDRVFSGSVFWMVTRSNECFY